MITCAAAASALASTSTERAHLTLTGLSFGHASEEI